MGDKFKNNQDGFTKNNIKDTITIDGLKGFEKHNNRLCKVENCDPTKSKDNVILIGDENVVDIVNEYLKGVKLRSNSVIARELVLSGGNGFYKRMTPLQRQTWLNANMKFLEDNFGSNCVYAILHMDETTVHIHALIVPRFWNEERKLYELKNARYFDGKDKMSAWQDNYTKYMCQDLNNVFMRGIKGSKATHVDLKTYYSLIKEDMDERKSESIVAHAKENHLNKKKVQELEATLKGQEATIEACESIIKANKELKNSKALYEHTIRTLASKYKIPKEEVIKILDSKKSKEVVKRNKNRER